MQVLVVHYHQLPHGTELKPQVRDSHSMKFSARVLHFTQRLIDHGQKVSHTVLIMVD